VEALVAGRADDEQDATGAVLRELIQLQTPSPDPITESVKTLRQATQAQEQVAGTDADRARRLAEILEQALELHNHHGDGDCPVCGQALSLNTAWYEKAENEAKALRKQAEAADRAHRELRQAEQAARALITSPPATLLKAAELGIDTKKAEATWTQWSEAKNATGEDLATHLESQAPELNLVIEDLGEQAQKQLKERDDAWRPLAISLAEWLSGARELVSESETVKHLKSADDWIRSTATDIRNERFEPIKRKVKEIWALLRTNSNVDLADITFEGKTTSRRVKLDVTVDGTESAALGVMSQGELHSLALALFLPRASLDASPFRFLVIDDPVQSMDPVRVDGLAKVLHEVAKDRHVIVFTHDDRLPEAVRRLNVPAKVIEVLRREDSIVELREVRSPVRQYLEDAAALVNTDDLPKIARERGVPNLCRLGLEAACLDVVRRRRLQNGDFHASVEKLFNDQTKLLPRLALAFFDDPDKAGDVYTRLKNQIGPWPVDTVKMCNVGSHKGLGAFDDARSFVSNVKQLANELLKL